MSAGPRKQERQCRLQRPVDPRQTATVPLRGAVPAEVDTIIGRREELAGLLHDLDRARLVTVVGAAGSGKTRLALRAATRVQRTAARVRWVSLVEVDRSSATVEGLTRHVATALSIQHFGMDPPRDQLIATLAAEPTLVVMDNCEHVVEQAAALVGDLVRSVPTLTVLATSRERLRVDGERPFRLPPLSYPPETAEDFAGYDALALLEDRAAALNKPIAAADRAAAARLCRILDGLPLAIELAAHMLPVLTVTRLTELLTERAEARFTLLRTRPRPGEPVLHHSLSACLDQSYELCTPAERMLWEQVSVFVGGFELSAVEAVCRAGDRCRSTDEVLMLLQQLEAKSILQTDSAGRFQMLETLRAYGVARLRGRDTTATQAADGDDGLGGREASDAGDDDREIRVRRAHARHFAAAAAAAARDWLGPREAELLAWSRTELPNHRAAMEWSLTRRDLEDAVLGLRIALGLTGLRAWFYLADLQQGYDWLTRAVHAVAVLRDVAGPVDATFNAAVRGLLVDATAQAGWIAVCQGRREVAEQLLIRCLEMVDVAVRVRDIPDLADNPGCDLSPSVLFLAGAVLMLLYRDPRAAAVLARARQGFAVLGSAYRGAAAMAELFEALAAAFFAAGPEALRITRRCQDNAEATGADWAISWGRIARGMALMWHGDRRRALTLLRVALRRQIQMGDGWGTIWAAHAIAWAAAAILAARLGHDRDRDVAGARLIALLVGGTEVLRTNTGVDMEGGLGPFHDATAHARDVAQHVLRDAYAAVEARGRTLPHQVVLDLAAGTTSPEEILAAAPATVAGTPPVATPGARIVRHAGAVPPRSGAGSPRWRSLTESERRVAVLAAAGMSNQQIATRRSCSISTVKHHMTTLLSKLAIDNRHEIAPFIPTSEKLAEQTGSDS